MQLHLMFFLQDSNLPITALKMESQPKFLNKAKAKYLWLVLQSVLAQEIFYFSVEILCKTQV